MNKKRLPIFERLAVAPIGNTRTFVGNIDVAVDLERRYNAMVEAAEKHIKQIDELRGAVSRQGGSAPKDPIELKQAIEEAKK